MHDKFYIYCVVHTIYYSNCKFYFTIHVLPNIYNFIMCRVLQLIVASFD